MSNHRGRADQTRECGNSRPRSDDGLDEGGSPDPETSHGGQKKARTADQPPDHGTSDIGAHPIPFPILRSDHENCCTDSYPETGQEICTPQNTCQTVEHGGRHPVKPRNPKTSHGKTSPKTQPHGTDSHDPVRKEKRPLVDLSANGVTGKPLAFRIIVGLVQRTPPWYLAREGATGERRGSSSIANTSGGGFGSVRELVVYESYQQKTDGKFEGNEFTVRGNKFEPCVRILHEHVTGFTIYDGGYWVPKDEAIKEFYGDSPDGIWMKKNPQTGVLQIAGMAEYKYVMSRRTEMPLYHVIQCMVHAHATSSPIAHYLSVYANEKCKLPNWVEGEPFLLHVLYTWVEYNPHFMDLVFRRASGVRECVRWNKNNPWAPIMPQWGTIQFDGKCVVKCPIPSNAELDGHFSMIQYMVQNSQNPGEEILMLSQMEAEVMCDRWNNSNPDSTIGPGWKPASETRKQYGIKSSREFHLVIHEKPVNVLELNKKRIFKDWEKEPYPDGLPWEPVNNL